MENNFRSFFERKRFDLKNGIFYQGSFTQIDFEQKYLTLRKEEGRLYADELVKNLPFVPFDHPLMNEWKIRRRTTNKLISYLKEKKFQDVMEIGCGNGWLISRINRSLQNNCCGIDVNEYELLQASKIFSNDMITFAHADILSQDFDEPIADVIILASVIQYFPDLEKLLNKIKGLLKPFGEIHILDSPLYSEGAVRSAKERSMNYFSRANQEGMNSYYHHHTWDSLSGTGYNVLYDPESGWERLKQVFIKDSPFPWLKLIA